MLQETNVHKNSWGRQNETKRESVDLEAWRSLSFCGWMPL